ncbi:unnamed protein product [Lota lota]
MHDFRHIGARTVHNGKLRRGPPRVDQRRVWLPSGSARGVRLTTESRRALTGALSDDVGIMVMCVSQSSSSPPGSIMFDGFPVKVLSRDRVKLKEK